VASRWLWFGVSEPRFVHWWWVFYLVGSGLSSLAGNLIGDAASIGAMNTAVGIDATA
jgi:hypothetical protein